MSSEKKKEPNKLTPKRKTTYLTKQTLVKSATSAGLKASKRAMATAGYVIKAKDGWVVKEFTDGRVRKLKKLKQTKTPAKIVLD